MPLESKPHIRSIAKKLHTFAYMGNAKQILGIKIVRDRNANSLYFSQKGYIEKVLHMFNMHSCKPVSTPLASHFKL